MGSPKTRSAARLEATLSECSREILEETSFECLTILRRKTAVVFGVANKRSIAWAIAQGLHAAGLNMAITYQNERMEMEAKDLILSLPGAEGFMCDVSKDEEIASFFEKLKARYGKLHALVHSVAYAPAEELKGDFVNTDARGIPHRA